MVIRAPVPGAGLIAGFERRRLPGYDIQVDALIGGSGPPLLLLHGYPQTRVMWKAVAPRLADHFTVVVPDLRGYGRSDKLPGDASHSLYSKRIMAQDQVKMMRSLGFDNFAVAGHDRGGRVAYRLALDHGEKISKVAVLDIIPTAEVWANANAKSAMNMFHWYLLAQPRPLPENLIGANPEVFIKQMLKKWAGKGFEFDPESLADYVECFSDPACIHATCEDYRAGWTLDRQYDEADLGLKKITAPLLVLWGEQYGVAKAEPLETWRRWADGVRGQGIPGGHFICEESPEETANALLDFFRS